MRKGPKIVYKYRVWDNASHKNILLCNELYLASPKDFNDPFDCRIPPNFKLLKRKSQIDKYLRNMEINHTAEANDRRVDIKKYLDNLRVKIQNGSVQSEIEQLEFEKMCNHYGIISLSCRDDSVLLWSHYANSHVGFCIGFFELKLRNSIKSSSVLAGIVDYRKNFPKVTPKALTSSKDSEIIERLFEQTLVKSEDWSYEEEYRILANFYPDIKNVNERIFTFPDDAIAEVILGMNMAQPNKDEIIAICKTKGIKVFQARKSAFRFQIEKEEIL